MFVRVHILDAPYSIDKLYEYYVPDSLKESVGRGSVVGVPFGGGNKSVRAVVFSTSDRSEYETLKPVSSVTDELCVSDEMLETALFMKEQTFCTVGDALTSAIPFYAFGRLTDTYSVVPGADLAPLNERSAEVARFIAGEGEANASKLKKKFGEPVGKILSSLVSGGIVSKRAEITDAGRKFENMVSLAVSADEAQAALDKMRASRAKTALSSLIDAGGRLPESELRGFSGCERVHIRNLCEKGLVRLEKFDIYRDPYSEKNIGEERNDVLSPHQNEAYKKIEKLIDSGEPKAALLHGITGSGKTQVIKAVIDRTIGSGRQAIVLVPEISLTPQTVTIFKAYYKDRVAVLHSSLSDGERYDAWRKIKNGEVDVCVGTRSAVFAPFERLGLIVIDEEQEHTYKSEMSPRYHARDVARFRVAYNKCLMLLASATPSFESYYKAKAGIYSLIELTERYGNAVLPETKIIDMRIDKPVTSSLTSVGETLFNTLRETLGKKEQAILFINRRGYNNLISCANCGSPVVCPRCSVSMTFHSPGRVFADEGEDERQARIKNGWLSCHYCGERHRVPEKCPTCGSPYLKFLGAGTQRAEEEIRLLFPDARIMRMDADTTTKKFSYDDILDRFRSGDADILLGTQMVTKGHDFPNVTCVGVLSADASLYMDDYRASERTFDLLTQCLGRAGRGDKKGVAVIQTYSPDHSTLKFAANQDYRSFYENEILLRKSYVFPPFCDMLLITQSSSSESELMAAAVKLSSMIKEGVREEYSDVKLTLYGPFEAPVYKIKERYRVQTVIKCRSDKRSRALFSKIYAECEKKFGKKIQTTFDMNPNIV